MISASAFSRARNGHRARGCGPAGLSRLARWHRPGGNLRIVGSIYATEAIHYAIFEDTFGGITAFQNGAGTLVVPDLTEGKHGSAHVMPKRCVFFDRDLPTCSVIRPSATANAGAIAAVKALTASNLFQGQSKGFFRTLNELAEQADAAVRLAAGNAG